MLTLRRAEERGHANFGWLDSRHTLLVRRLLRPEHMGFRPLRVINDDRVAGGGGFGDPSASRHGDHLLRARGRARAQGQHGHRLGDPPRRRAAHERGHRRRAQRVQRVEDEPVHFLQIWIMPERAGHRAELRAEDVLATPTSAASCASSRSRDGRDGSVTIHQDVELYASLLDDGRRGRRTRSKAGRARLGAGRARRSARSTASSCGRATALPSEEAGKLQLLSTAKDTEVLLFDLGAETEAKAREADARY